MWIRGDFDPNARVRMFVLPHAGGGSADYRPLVDAFHDDVHVDIVVYPGREHRLREPPCEDLLSLVGDLSRATESRVEAGPYVVYGHSMGAWVAFEWVRAQRRRGLPLPAALILGARRAPQCPPRQPLLSELDDAPFIEGVQERYGAIPKVLRDNDELMRLFLPALRADFRLLDRHVHRDEPPIDVPLWVLHGQHDGVEHEEDTRAWRIHTTQAFSFQKVPGGHFFARESPDALADIIDHVIATTCPSR